MFATIAFAWDRSEPVITSPCQGEDSGFDPRRSRQMNLSNIKIAKLLRSVAAALTIKKIGNVFQVRAYENAADSIEHLTTEIHNLWKENSLEQVPGLGEKIRGYLDELFKTGKVEHFEQAKKDIPDVVFELLDIPGVGPQTAMKLADLGVKSLDDLKKQIKSGAIVEKGFSAKLAQNIMHGLLSEYTNTKDRMLLPQAMAQAERVISYLKTCIDVKEVDTLGSLRRMVATIGDLDFSASSNNPIKVIEYFCKMPGITRILDQGENKATVVLQSGLLVDLLVGKPDAYGALLQHFTGSKNHNIHLRTLAEKKGNILQAISSEKELYKLMGMDVPPPEIREDTGEIEAALVHKLPELIESADIKGDLHIHTNYPFEHSSHGPGADSIEEMINNAKNLKYDFIGISDHPPGHSSVGKEAMIESIKKRTNVIHQAQLKTNSIRVLNGLEIDILSDGSLSVPDEALQTLDYCIAGIHSGHRGSKEQITKRLMAALNNPHVDVISHPTGRLINERDSSDADWPEIFKVAAKNNKILEINSHPIRLDLRDDLVREALRYGVKFIINTDAHAIDQMNNMPYGISVARRGWATKEDIVNSWDWTKFAKWFKL